MEVSNPVLSEIDAIVAQAQMSDEAGESEDVIDVEPEAGEPTEENPEGEVVATATTKRKPRKKPVKKTEAKPPAEQTMDQLNVDDLLPAKLPKAAENVKTLDTMYAKYGVGDSPDFKVQLWRTWPKMAPGGKKFDGFYDTWEIPIQMEQIQAEYGGGSYRVTVVGPHPNRPNLTKHYDSVSIQLAGDPKWTRVPRALQGSEPKSDNDESSMGRMQMPLAVENPKLAEAALNILSKTAESEREERRRSEDRVREERERARDNVQPIIETERRHHDTLLAMERRRAEERETAAEERHSESRARFENDRRRMESENHSRPTMAQELSTLANSGLFNRDDSTSKEMFTQILEKHRSEMDAVISRQTQFVESIRSGHMTELQAIRDANQRELAAEREASRSRESRIEERLTAEREERRRDQDRFREQIEERDKQWRDRMDSSKAVLESSWESRHQSLVATYEQRVLWLQQETDRLKSDLTESKMKQEERTDITTQLIKMREMNDLIKGFSPAAPAPAAPTGGIGLMGGGEDWKNALAEGVGERLPQIAQAIFGGAAQQGQPAAQPQQLTEGQVLMNDPSTGQPFPHGPMVVVRDPNTGQLAMSPKAAIDAHQRAAAERSGQLLPGPRPQRRRQPEKKKPSAVHDFSKGFPKQVPPWDHETEEEGAHEPPKQPRMTTQARSQLAEPASNEPMELNAQERQGIKMIAKIVHEAVMQADEPSEFVDKLLGGYDPAVLKAVIGSYTPEQIARGVSQVEPSSAGATPAGQDFIRLAFGKLRQALA